MAVTTKELDPHKLSNIREDGRDRAEYTGCGVTFGFELLQRLGTLYLTTSGDSGMFGFWGFWQKVYNFM